MKAAISFLALIILFVGTFVLYNSLYTVDQVEQVIITQFGKPVGEAINSDPLKNEAGLHFKTPFVQEVNRFEKRIIGWDGPPTDMPTRDKLYIIVNAFARWRISDPLKYLQSLRDERNALSRLDDIIGSETRNVVARHDLIEVIRTDKTRKLQADEALAQAGITVGALPAIQHGREKLEREILAAAAPKVTSWGIELLDVRFKRINYKPGVIEKIYERMISERLQIAELFRSEGAGEAAKILGRKEKDLSQIESDAYRRVQEVQGAADAKASEIFANAYNTSPDAANFYQFMKTLETYKATLGQDSTMILTTDSDLFKYLKRIDGGEARPAPSTPAKAPVSAPAEPAPKPVVPPVAPIISPPAPAAAPAPAPAPQPVPAAPAPAGA